MIEYIGQGLIRFDKNKKPQFASVRLVGEDKIPTRIIKKDREEVGFNELIQSIRDTHSLMYWSSVIHHRDKSFSLVMVHMSFVVQLEEFDKLFKES